MITTLIRLPYLSLKKRPPDMAQNPAYQAQ
jgi:hypothetical protein